MRSIGFPAQQGACFSLCLSSPRCSCSPCQINFKKKIFLRKLQKVLSTLAHSTLQSSRQPSPSPCSLIPRRADGGSWTGFGLPLLASLLIPCVTLGRHGDLSEPWSLTVHPKAKFQLRTCRAAQCWCARPSNDVSSSGPGQPEGIPRPVVHSATWQQTSTADPKGPISLSH